MLSNALMRLAVFLGKLPSRIIPEGDRMESFHV